LFQSDHRGGHLILKKRVAAIGVNRFHPRGHDRIAGDRKRQAIDDHATQLLALHVHALPEGRSGKQDGIWREPKLLEQRALRRITLPQQRELQLAQQSLVDVIHLRVTGEEDEGAPAGNFQQLANALRGLEP
jgi:hypothetical protein